MTETTLTTQDWPTRPVWACLRTREVFGGEGPLLSMSAAHGIRERVEGEGRAASEDTAGYRSVEPGDIVINRLVAKDGAIAVSAMAGLVSPAYWVLIPSADLDARFVDYALNSAPYLAEIGRRSKYMPPAQFDLPWEQFRTMRLPVPPLAEQRAIADYLDTETARIDALIAKKRRLRALLEESIARRIEKAARALAETHDDVRLKFASAEILVGIVVTPAAYYVDDGVPALRGTNVLPGSLRFDDLVHISTEGDLLHAKSQLKDGDVVVVRTGKAGAACVVPPELDGWNCIDLLIIRRSRRLLPKYLEYILNSDWTVQHIERNSVGSIQSHFNVAALKDLPIPLPSVDVQQRVALELGAFSDRLEDCTSRLDQQVDLLVEMRQALITAAVTGELSIPGLG